MAHEFSLSPGKTVYYDALLVALLEHEGHRLIVRRVTNENDNLEVWLACWEIGCENNAGIIFLRLEQTVRVISLEFEVRSWFREEMPDAGELAQGIDSGLSKEWHSPDNGDSWWVDSSRGVEPE